MIFLRRSYFFLLEAFMLVLFSLLLVACTSSFLPKNPFAKIATPNATVKQTGPAATPTRVATADTETTIPLPPGVTITITSAPANAAAVPSVAGTSTTPTAPLPVVHVTEHRESIVGPTSFQPSAGPTPKETADATAQMWMWGIAGGCLILAGLLAYRRHFKAAAFAGAAAIGFPLLKTFVDVLIANIFGIVCITAALVLFWAWHIMNDKTQTPLEHIKHDLGLPPSPPAPPSVPTAPAV